MTLKKWIDEIKTEEGGQKSETPLKLVNAPLDDFFPGEKEAWEILLTATRQIEAGGVFYSTPERQTTEEEIDGTYKAIIAGGSDFDALRTACARWVKAAQTRPTPPATASLLPEVKI